MINYRPNCIIVGYFNKQSHLRDSFQPPDAQGNKLEEWIYDLNLQVLNNVSPTRTSCITGNDSSPDLSISGETWSTKTSSEKPWMTPHVQAKIQTRNQL